MQAYKYGNQLQLLYVECLFAQEAANSSSMAVQLKINPNKLLSNARRTWPVHAF